jgi:hypothetical protein
MFQRMTALATFMAGVLAIPAAAQAPAPVTSAFDGSYVGTATVTYDKGGFVAR